MTVVKIVSMILKQLTPINGVIFLLVGLYSLSFNARIARRKNHRRAERVAKAGGWLYTICGIAILSKLFF